MHQTRNVSHAYNRHVQKVVNVDKRESFTRVLACHPYYQSTIYSSFGAYIRGQPQQVAPT
jgi:hypothetical protein